MKTYDVRQLVENKKQVIDGSCYHAFTVWKKMFVEVIGKEPTEFDIFNAGYMIANPSVKDLLKKKEIKEKYDRRISNELWRRV